MSESPSRAAGAMCVDGPKQERLEPARQGASMAAKTDPTACRGVAWSQDWLRQVYTECASHQGCCNEFGVAWRYLVPELRRANKRVGVCLCRIYSDPCRRDPVLTMGHQECKKPE